MVSAFRYWSRHAVRVGDRIRYCGCDGVVAEIIAPGSELARDCGCPEGAVAIRVYQQGRTGAVRLRPPGGKYWEDLDFVARAPTAGPPRARGSR